MEFLLRNNYCRVRFGLILRALKMSASFALALVKMGPRSRLRSSLKNDRALAVARAHKSFENRGMKQLIMDL